MTKFQSSPALKDRCNVYRDYRVRGGYEFQSSPALKDRCNSSVQRGGRHFSVSILTGLERPVQQMPPGIPRPGGMQFQSSPALKDRCNMVVGYRRISGPPVSILTGLERPVQRAKVFKCYPLACGFNPHRP